MCPGMEDSVMNCRSLSTMQEQLPMKKGSLVDPRISSGSCSMESQDSGVFCDVTESPCANEDSKVVAPATGQPRLASCYGRRRQFKELQHPQVSPLGPENVGGQNPAPSRRTVGVNTGPLVYDTGYDNLVVGQFMPPSPKTGSWLLNSSASQASSLSGRSGSTMHLDFLSSPRDSSYLSPQSLSSPTSKEFPQDKFLYRQTNVDSSPLFYHLEASSSDQDTLDSILAATSADLFGSTLLNANDLLLSPTYTDPLSPTATTFQDRSSRQSWSKYSVLPPLAQPGAHEQNEPSMAPSVQHQPMFIPAFFTESSTCSSSFASPKHSTRSSYSGRGSSKKRALSNSPLSIEGIDFNSLIRMSPTSLIPFPNSTTGSITNLNTCLNERQGCYGHLSARNSSSGSTGSSVTRLSLSSTCNVQNSAKDFENLSDIDSQLLAYQAMQLLEAANIPTQDCMVADNHLVLPQESLQNLEENLIYRAGLYGGIEAEPQPQIQEPAALTTPIVPDRPPPSYNQHMARKFFLQKKNSSDSSQPSNYSSFESSEGERVGELDEGQTYPTQFCSGRCLWTDCGQLFTGQEELVRHLEKAHVDQRKGDEYTCFWQGCTRKLRPFNARYKLLIHMRVHSGEKPNRCTFEGCQKAFSRLENLKIHLRSHTGERPYACQHPSCNKAFSNSSDRAKHQRTHQDTKPYACGIAGCNKRYTDPSSLRKHVKNHTTPKPDMAKKRLRSGLSFDGCSNVGPDFEQSLSDCLTVRPLRPRCGNSVCNVTSGELVSSSTGFPNLNAARSPPEPCMDSGLGRSPPPPLHSMAMTTTRHVKAEPFIGYTYPGAKTCSNPGSPMSQDLGSPGLAELFESDESMLECLPFLPAITSPVSGVMRGQPGSVSETRRSTSEPLPPIVGCRTPTAPPSVVKIENSSGFPSFRDSFPKCAVSFQSLSNN